MFKWIILPFQEKKEGLSFSHQKPDGKFSDVLKWPTSPSCSLCCKKGPTGGWRHVGKRDLEEGVVEQVLGNKRVVTGMQGSESYEKSVACKQNHEDSWLQGATEIREKLSTLCN